ncbi:D-alanine--D-alanine ligase [Neptunitalea sp. Y10]|uniref:D-alanine--D-alanine ligase n=2 Tax=Neptunitalea lumnitzerae TaxID=2965509 RepID=A0ABQ5MHP4_9FLAO|nr:D-alanine--D-alanine ligase [Neptunitalea sp. Y10]
MPIFFAWPYFALKAGNWFFFNCVNPGIKNGGFIMNSKKEIYDAIPAQYYPKTVLVRPTDTIRAVSDKLNKNTLQYPVFVKPDIGLRGTGVERINDVLGLEQYHSTVRTSYLIQEVIPFKNEAGIFYVRKPNEDKGNITGIVYKELLTVVGDGTSSVEELLNTNKRFAFQLKTLRQSHQDELKTILEKGVSKVLVPYGNHCRGAKFLDARSMITPELETCIDEVCKQIPGFYYGRIDLMFASWELLSAGKQFAIVELNGAVSEPAHIYDPKHTIWFAWKELWKHFNLMAGIARLNKSKGLKNVPVTKGVIELSKHFKYLKSIQ